MSNKMCLKIIEKEKRKKVIKIADEFIEIKQKFYEVCEGIICPTIIL